MSSPLDDFLEAYWRDRDAGDVLALADYLAGVPASDQPAIAAEYLALEDDAPAIAPPDRASDAMCGPYRLLRSLGRGGQGEVHLAEDTRLGRQVALKILTNVGLVSDSIASRFRREAEVASRIDHPGISTVFEAGAHEGTLFIAMRYVEGDTLREKIAAAQDATGRTYGAITLNSDASQPSVREGILAVVAVFEKVTRAAHAAHEQGIVHRDLKPGNIIVTPDNEPVILDFGLARDLGSLEQSLTVTGDMFGTPAYMAPEQLGDQRVALDARVDVFALGVTLYECLTLRRPFEGASRDALFRSILQSRPPDPRELNPAIPSDLKTVLEVALEKNRDHRYRTALDLAIDLAHVRENEPIRARPAGPTQRLGRWVQRNPGLAALWLGIVAALVVALWLLRQNSLALGAVQTQRDRNRRFELVLLARQQAERNPGLALLLALEAAKQGTGPFEHEALHRALANLRELRTLAVDDGPVSAVSFDAGGDRFSATSDRLTQVWRTDTGERLESREGTFVFAGDTLVAAPPASTRDPGRVYSADRSLQAAASDEAVQVTGDALVVMPRPLGPLHAMAFSSDNARLGVAADGNAYVFSLRSGQVTTTLTGHRGAVRAIAFHPDGRRVLTGGEDGTVRLWVIAAPELAPIQLDVGPAGIASTVISEDGRLLALGGDERRAPRLVDTVTGEVVASLPHSDATRSDVSFSSDGRHTIVIERSGRTFIHDRNGARKRTIPTPTRPLSVDVDSNAMRAITGDSEGRVILWDLERARVLAAEVAHRGPVGVARLSPDGRRAVSAADDGTAILWDLDTATIRRRLDPAKTAVRVVRFDPTAARFVTGARDGSTRLWAAEDGSLVFTPAPAGGELLAVRFSNDGSRLAVLGDRDGNAIWTLPDGTRTRFGAGRRDEDLVGFSPDGTQLLTRADDRITLQHTDSDAPAMHLTHSAPIVAAALTRAPDRTWRVVAFGEDGRLYRWALDPVAVARARSPRALTAVEREDYSLEEIER